MTRLISNIVGIAFFALVLLFVADLAYTEILSSAPPTDKLTLLKSYKGKKVNYIFVGSSRVNNNIIPAVIEQRTGKTALNLGISAARPSDILTLVKLIKENDIECDSIFVQVDYSFNNLDNSTVFEYYTMPFIWRDPVLQQHVDYLPDAFAIKYVPFYRYAAYDQRIGIRAIYKALITKRPTDLQTTSGYVPRSGQSLLPEYSHPDKIIARNVYHEQLETFGAKENLKLVFFTAPFMKSVKTKEFMQQLKRKIPELRDYSRAIETDSVFANQSHLNNSGATIFTNMIVDDLLLIGQ